MLSVETLDGDSGIVVTDRIERRQYRLYTPEPVSPRAVDESSLRYPVDGAASITTDAVTAREVVDVVIRGVDGEVVTHAKPPCRQTLRRGRYSVELNAPAKLYLEADGPLDLSTDTDRIRLEFDRPTEVLVGARSYHQRPAATVTTTADPVDMMAAVSALGSALKTTTCERSYPTLRGHPPTIDLGERLRVPDCLDVPDTGVRLEVPPTYRHVYVVAPLAYYLGATVTPASTPRLVTADGFEHGLDTDRGFENEVERLLKQVFLFDCVTRTEGSHRVDLYEREQVESVVDLDFAALYDAPLAAQLEAYLSVPFDAVEQHVPRWNLTAHVETTPERVSALPFVVGDLAVVRPAAGETLSPSAAQSVVVDSYLSERGADSGSSRSEAESLVRVEQTDSLEQAWFADGIPVQASKAVTRAFRNGLDRSPKDGHIDITVVCNDGEMDEEHDAVKDAYGTRANLSFDVTLHRDLSTRELRSVLAADTDFLHFIGHCEDAGFRCRDGTLDVAELDSVGVQAFLLNACRSYRQGIGLIDSGSTGGVVTLSDVSNGGAVRVGKTMARLLDRGFPLRAALDIAQGESVVGGQYLVVGDGNVDIVHGEGGVALVCSVADAESSGDGQYELTLEAYPPREGGMGSLVYPTLTESDQHFLPPGPLETFELSADELRTYVESHRHPIKEERELRFGGSRGLFDRTHGP